MQISLKSVTVFHISPAEGTQGSSGVMSQPQLLCFTCHLIGVQLHSTIYIWSRYKGWSTKGLQIFGLKDAVWIQRMILPTRTWSTEKELPLHFKSMPRDRGCLFSISRLLSSSWPPAVGLLLFCQMDNKKQLNKKTKKKKKTINKRRNSSDKASLKS